MKRFLVILGLLAGLAAVGVIALLLLVDVNAYKPRIEAAASDALGMEVRIRGKAALSLFPTVGISIADVHVRNRGTELAKAGSLRIGVKLIPLLGRQVRITEFVLEKPEVHVEKGKDGTFNFETPPRASRPAPSALEAAALFVRDSAVRGGRFRYVDRKTGSRMELDGVDLTVRDLSLGGKAGAGFVKTLSFTADLRIGGFRAGNVSASDVRAEIRAAGGIFRVRPVTMRMFGGSGKGEIEADLSGETNALTVRYTLSGFRAEDALSAISDRKDIVSGPLSISPDLSFRGKDADAMIRSMSGTVSLRGEDLTLRGLDLDGTLAKVSQARRVGIADVGAFLLAGPVGPLATKGYDVGGIYTSARGGETRIVRLVSDWTVAKGVAEARDVAFATRKNRIALKGKLDIANRRFAGATVASLDGKGCAKLRQGIDGPFGDPTLDKVSTLESAAGPLLGLFGDTKRMLTGGECEPFYAGTVAHPK